MGISLSGLASAVANEGGLGVISAAGVGRELPDFHLNLQAADEKALRLEIREARKLSSGAIGVNLMMALSDFENLFKVVIEEGTDAVFVGAGLLVRIPSSVGVDRLLSSRTAIVPKVSSAKAARVILASWDRHYGTIPDGIVVEGPLAGGHLGFSRAQLEEGAPTLEKIVGETLEVADRYAQHYGRAVPVIAAGGIYYGSDIRCIMEMGAAGVKMGTRFVATQECDAHQAFKQAYVDCRQENLKIIESPVGLPGRAIVSPFLEAVGMGERKPLGCLWKCLRTCDLKKAPYCIAKALMAAKMGELEEGFAFAGANASLIEKIVSVKELFAELASEFVLSYGKRCSMAASAV